MGSVRVEAFLTGLIRVHGASDLGPTKIQTAENNGPFVNSKLNLIPPRVRFTIRLFTDKICDYIKIKVNFIICDSANKKHGRVSESA